MPFLHVTTKIDGQPNDDLLARFGRYGFPTLLLAEADGAALGEITERSVFAFEQALEAALWIDEVRARAAAGDAEMQVELLLARHALSQVPPDEFEQRSVELLDSATAEQKARIEQVRADARIWKAAQQAYSGRRDDAVAELLALHAAGERPSPSSRAATGMWSLLGEHALSTGDTVLLKACAAGMLDDFSDDEAMQARAHAYARVAEGLKERDALRARTAAGEQGLEARVLLIEARLGATTLARLCAQKEAALSVATAAQRAELAQLELDLELKELCAGYYESADRLDTGRRILALLEGEPLRPKEGEPRPIASFLREFAQGSPDLLERGAKALERCWPQRDDALEAAARLRAWADDLR